MNPVSETEIKEKGTLFLQKNITREIPQTTLQFKRTGTNVLFCSYRSPLTCNQKYNDKGNQTHSRGTYTKHTRHSRSGSQIASGPRPKRTEQNFCDCFHQKKQERHHQWHVKPTTAIKQRTELKRILLVPCQMESLRCESRYILEDCSSNQLAPPSKTATTEQEEQEHHPPI